MKVNYILFYLVLLPFCVFASNHAAFDTSESVAAYQLTDKDVVVENGKMLSCSYDFSQSNIIIPGRLDGQVVEVLAENLFYNKNLTDVVLPTSLKRIESSCFYFSKLDTIILSECHSLEFVGSSAFGNNNFRWFVFPVNEAPNFMGWKQESWLSSTGDLKPGGDMAYCALNVDHTAMFMSEYTLTDNDVSVSNGTIYSTTLARGSRRYKLTIPEVLDNQTIIGIGKEVFKSKDILDIKLPTTLEKIYDDAFSYNLLDSVDLNQCPNLRFVGDDVFSQNSFRYFPLPALEQENFVGWNIRINNRIIAPDTDVYTDQPYYALFEEIHTLSDADVTMSNGTITAFKLNTDNTCYRLTIPEVLNGDTVIGVASNVFAGDNLIELHLPATVEVLGRNCFGDNMLNEIELSHCTKLRLLEYDVFDGNLASRFKLPFSELDNFVGWQKSTYFNIVKPGSAVELSNSYTAIVYTEMVLNDSNVIVEDGVITSCSYGFDDICYRLMIPEVLDSQIVTEIAPSVFYRSKLVLVDFPPSIEGIGYRAFNRNELIEINLDSCKKLTYIGNSAFGDNLCYSFDLPNSKTDRIIDWRDDVGDLLNGSVECYDHHGSYYAEYVYTLKDSDVDMQNDTIIACQLSFDDRYVHLCIPEIIKGYSVVALGEKTFCQNELFALDLPKNLRYIGYKCFDSCDLNSVDFGKCTNLRKVGQGAFMNNNLAGISLDSCTALYSIGERAFDYNDLLSGFYLPEPTFEDFEYWLNDDKSSLPASTYVSDLLSSYVCNVEPSKMLVHPDKEVKVYPNPFTSDFNIEIDGACKIKIANLSGKVILANVVLENMVNVKVLSGYESGVYLIYLDYGDHQDVKYLLKR